jgi:hypothetical protein
MVGLDEAGVDADAVSHLVSLGRSWWGADRGAEPSWRVLAVAGASSPEPVSGQFNAPTAVTGTCWLSMVRRRSTVRFRKGAPRSEASFDNEPVTSVGGFQRKEQVSGSVGSQSPRKAEGPGWSGSVTRVGGGAVGALRRARSLSSGLEGHVRSGGRPHVASLRDGAGGLVDMRGAARAADPPERSVLVNGQSWSELPDYPPSCSDQQ